MVLRPTRCGKCGKLDSHDRMTEQPGGGYMCHSCMISLTIAVIGELDERLKMVEVKHNLLIDKMEEFEKNIQANADAVEQLRMEVLG